jgi:WD40 repeat protein
VATASEDNTGRRFDPATGTEIAAFRPAEILKGPVSRSAAFSADGKRVVTASEDNTARLWDAETGKEIAVLQGHEQSVQSAAFSPDGKRVVTASKDNTARLWDAATSTEIAVLQGHEQSVQSVAFSPDGKRVLTVDDFAARLWDTETATEIAVLKARKSAVNRAAFSPDGKRVVTESFDNTGRFMYGGPPQAHIWDAETGTEIAALKANEELAEILKGSVSQGAAFSPDGKRLVTASDDTVRLWDVSRIAVGVRGQALVLAAALAQGVGWRTANERLDLLLQDAPEDMFSAALLVIGDRAVAVAETVAVLHAALHPNCYLSPTEFAAKFGLTPPRNTDLPATSE